MQIDFMTLWDYQDPVTSATRFQTQLAEAVASGDLPLELELITQLARTHTLRHQFDEAHQLLDAMTPRLTAHTERARLRWLLERGRCFNSAADKEAARPLFEQAWQLALTLNEDYLAIDAAHMVAIVAPLPEQSRWHELAITLAERSPDPLARGWLASLYNNQGWTLFEQGRFDQALICQQKCLAWHQAQGHQGKTFIARWSLARIQRAQGQHQEALNALLALQTEMQDAGEQEDGYLYEELGENYLVIDETLAAEPFARAWFLLSQDAWCRINEGERLARLKQLARL